MWLNSTLAGGKLCVQLGVVTSTFRAATRAASRRSAGGILEVLQHLEEDHGVHRPVGEGDASAVVAVGLDPEAARRLHVLIHHIQRLDLEAALGEPLAVAARPAAEIEDPRAGAPGYEVHERRVHLGQRIGMAVPLARVPQPARHVGGPASAHARAPNTTSRLRGLIAYRSPA